VSEEVEKKRNIAVRSLSLQSVPVAENLSHNSPISFKPSRGNVGVALVD
jgi:hypothetical protein